MKQFPGTVDLMLVTSYREMCWFKSCHFCLLTACQPCCFLDLFWLYHREMKSLSWLTCRTLNLKHHVVCHTEPSVWALMETDDLIGSWLDKPFVHQVIWCWCILPCSSSLKRHWPVQTVVVQPWAPEMYLAIRMIHDVTIWWTFGSRLIRIYEVLMKRWGSRDGGCVKQC